MAAILYQDSIKGFGVSRSPAQVFNKVLKDANVKLAKQPKDVLERAATADARRLLQDLAGGAPEARLTQHARQVLARVIRFAPP